MKKNVKKVTIGVLSCSLLLTMSACTKKTFCRRSLAR